MGKCGLAHQAPKDQQRAVLRGRRGDGGTQGALRRAQLQVLAENPVGSCSLRGEAQAFGLAGA